MEEMKEYEIEEGNVKNLHITLYTKIRHEPIDYDVTIKKFDIDDKAIQITIKSHLTEVTLHPAHLEILRILEKEGYIPNL